MLNSSIFLISYKFPCRYSYSFVLLLVCDFYQGVVRLPRGCRLPLFFLSCQQPLLQP